MEKCRSYQLYGLDSYHQVMDDILALCRCATDRFPMALLISEALTNAYKHGNGLRSDQPIFLTVKMTQDEAIIKVKDSGQGVKTPLVHTEPDLWSESGRGLTLMRHYADEMHYDGATVIIRKKLCSA